MTWESTCVKTVCPKVLPLCVCISWYVILTGMCIYIFIYTYACSFGPLSVLSTNQAPFVECIIP